MFILASSSPRRSDLLHQAGYDFEVIPAQVNEACPHGTPPMQRVEQLARRKAIAVAKQHPGDAVLAADTLVAFKGRILGKPQTPEMAKKMLELLSGQVHQVYTAFCLIANNEVYEDKDCTSVEFYRIEPEEIEAYIASGEPLDKAGAYGIQGRGAVFVKRIDGSFTSVVGLPLGKIHRILKKVGIHPEK
ncbi:Maf family protein [Caproicibacterium sp. BJN0003]|uniref:Maf family protein n=1 Tax=Caproicibacterium sp. BJN0003 TaxID=2994078 RepID=UPI002259F0FC|nr:Maf family protein [Caproicibacterium sp. BJN0003]UZT82305.1 Maf family protein [Caproicibacterium sp. BJN0003]